MYPQRSRESTARPAQRDDSVIPQCIEQRAKRTTAMTHTLLHLPTRFTEREVQFLRPKQRIVAETLFTRRGFQHASLHLAHTNDLRVPVDERGRTDIPCATIFDAGQPLEQQTIVLVVERLARQVRASTPSLTPNARPAIQSVD